MSLVGLWSSSGSVVISWLVGCGHVLSLWSSSGLVVISWLVVCGQVLGESVPLSVVIFWGCGSFPGSWAVVMSWVDLWSSAGSVVISWLVSCGHLLGGSVLILWVCNHFLDRGLWSCPGWSVVIFWVCGHSLDRGLNMRTVNLTRVRIPIEDTIVKTIITMFHHPGTHTKPMVRHAPI